MSNTDYDKLYWECSGEDKPLSRKLFDTCNLHIWTKAEFDAIEKDSKQIKDSVETQWAAVLLKSMYSLTHHSLTFHISKDSLPVGSFYMKV